MKVKNYFVMMFAITALFACNNDDEGQGQLPEGKAYVSLNISLKDPGTKTVDPSDANAEDVEAVVKTIDVYLERDGAMTGYDQIASLNISSFNQMGNVYTTNSSVEVSGTAGDRTRRLFVVINKPLNFDPSYISTDGIYVDYINNLANASDGFVMFNASEVFANLEATDIDAAANVTQVSVERLAAKALLTTTLDFVNNVPDEQPDGSSTGAFQAHSLKWQIRNSNTQMYYIKKGDYKSPNWTYTPGSFSDYVSVPWGVDIEVPLASDLNLTGTGYMKDGTAKVQYFTENTNEKYVYGNTTLMTIQAAFVPTKIATGFNAGDDKFTMDDANTTLQTFYYAVAEKTYMTETAYNAFIAAHAGATVWGPYTNGVCYYQVPIGVAPLDDEANLGAKRNHFYKGNITKLIAPGQSKPDPDPDEPVIKDKVWIGVELTIEPWNMMDMGSIELQ